MLNFARGIPEISNNVDHGDISAGRSKRPEPWLLCGNRIVSGAHHVLLSQEDSAIETQRPGRAVEIAREEVPKPHPDKVWFGNLPSRDPSGRAALLTQEGVALPKGLAYFPSLTSTISSATCPWASS
jgi:hypothetical protein